MFILNITMRLHICMYVSDKTCGETLREKHGYFNSHGLYEGLSYQRSSTCSRFITGEETEVIRFKFTYFNVSIIKCLSFFGSETNCFRIVKNIDLSYVSTFRQCNWMCSQIQISLRKTFAPVYTSSKGPSH